MLVKPRKPSKPAVPTKTYMEERTKTLLEDYTEIDVFDFIKGTNDKLQEVRGEVKRGEPIKVQIAYDAGYYPEDGCTSHRLELVYQVEVENDKYDKHLKQYAKKEAKYKSAMKTYRKAMKQYREDMSKIEELLKIDRSKTLYLD